MSFLKTLAVALGVSAAPLLALAADPPAPRPKLLVLVYFDQFRGDYLRRWSNEFGEEGFKRLLTEGAWFENCHYPYAYTVTAAGHASVATGCPPADHGVVGNDWYQRSERKSVNCVGSDNSEQVPPAPPTGMTTTRRRGRKGAFPRSGS